ncbi:GvpL/GvpF family gas vesicle protein [Nocardioides sp. NBC_00368]|uniref:GvpL/GvpF family gas vesicle protein n=1 Tax=Nocardioides sp. NBC_00368 TaxID=2976000 RepID=UPI002E22C2B1
MLLYAVAAADAGSTGEEVDLPLRAHRSRGLTVFAEPRTQPPQRSTRELLGFGRALHQLWAYVPVLPMRFGTVVRDDDELDRLVAEHESEWSDRLAAVTGHSECIVHLLMPARAATVRTGSDYLRRRAMEVKQRDAETAELQALLAPYASEIRPLPPVRPHEVRLAVLVPDEHVEAVRTVVEEWSTNGPEATVTGPWPPFSFCQEAGE